jgi:hypothetical protein
MIYQLPLRWQWLYPSSSWLWFNGGKEILQTWSNEICYTVLRDVFNLILQMARIVSTLISAGVRDCWIFGLCPSFGIIKNTPFRKLNLFPFLGEGWETLSLLGPLEGTNLNHWTMVQQIKYLHPRHLRTETDPASETLCSLECQTTDEVQNPNIPQCYKS